MDNITPYKRPPLPSLWRMAWIEGTGGGLVRTLVSVVASVGAGVLGYWLFPEGGKILPGLEVLFAVTIGVFLLLGIYRLRGPIKTVTRQLEGAELAIAERDGVIEEYRQEIEDRVPQSVVDELSRLRKELNRDIWNNVPKDPDGIPEWWRRFEEWHQRTVDYMGQHFAQAVADDFEDVGVLIVTGMSNDTQPHVKLLAWKLNKLSEMIEKHTRATPSAFDD